MLPSTLSQLQPQHMSRLLPHFLFSFFSPLLLLAFKKAQRSHKKKKRLVWFIVVRLSRCSDYVVVLFVPIMFSNGKLISSGHANGRTHAKARPKSLPYDVEGETGSRLLDNVGHNRP